MNPTLKSIKDYENLYLIKDGGIVFSLIRNKIKKDWHHRDGYRIIGLIKNKKRTVFYVHRLVAEAYLPKIEGKEFVNHKDGNKADNHVSNLEWVTKSENSKHSFEIGTQDNKGENHPMSLLNEQKVIEIRNRFILGFKRKELAEMYGVKRSTIEKIINRKLWKHIQ